MAVPPRLVRLLRAGVKRAVPHAVGFLAKRPGLHRTIKLVYRVAPGVRIRLQRLLPPPPPPAARTAPHPSSLFRPGEVREDADGPVTVEQLFHMSRSLAGDPCRPSS